MSIEVTTTSSTTESLLEPGDFALFRYRDSEGNHSDREVLVMAYDDDASLVHGLDLDDFSDENLIEVGRELARLSNRTEEFELAFGDDGSITIDVQDSEMESWYDRLYDSSRFEDNPYRTFREDRIRNIYEAEATIT